MSKFKVAFVVAAWAALIGPSMAVVTITGPAVENFSPATGVYVLVASPTGSNFGVDANGSIAANSSLAVGSTLGGDVIFATSTSVSTFVGHTGSAVVNLNGFDPSTGAYGNIENEQFAVVWFPTLSAGATSVPAGTSYGFVTESNWIMPTNASNATDSFAPTGATFTTDTTPSAVSFTVAAAPEPTHGVLLAFALGAISLRRRRRKLAL